SAGPRPRAPTPPHGNCRARRIPQSLRAPPAGAPAPARRSPETESGGSSVPAASHPFTADGNKVAAKRPYVKMISVRPLLAYLPCLILLLVARPVVLQAQGEDLEGRNVLNIRFDPPTPGQPLDAEELFQILPLKTG